MGEKGITFIEMIVVIVIISVLTSLTSVGAYCTVADADAASDRIAGNLVTDAVSVYYHANGELPVLGEVEITEDERDFLWEKLDFVVSNRLIAEEFDLELEQVKELGEVGREERRKEIEEDIREKLMSSMKDVDDSVNRLIDGDDVNLEEYLIIDTEGDYGSLDGSVVRLDGRGSCTGDRWVVGTGTTRSLDVDPKLENDVGEEYWNAIKDSIEEEKE